MRKVVAVSLLVAFSFACEGPRSDDSIVPGPDAGPGGWGSDDGLKPPSADVHFLTSPPTNPACTADVAASFQPPDGYSGGLDGTGVCGPASPACPTTYVPGNVGAPCASSADCTGLAPVCLQGPRYPGGACSSTGCELGSSFGCPAGAVCTDGGDGQTYCVAGCGIDQSGCFLHCQRDGYSCFNTESRTLGTCFGTEGTRECDPSASAMCTMPAFGDGLCVQVAWDDQTVGKCFETCDPLAQDCSLEGNGCYPLREYGGYPICFQSWGQPEGSSCERLTQCAPGMRCACDGPERPCPTRHCRLYCALDGSTTCPDGTTCEATIDPTYYLGSCQP